MPWPTLAHRGMSPANRTRPFAGATFGPVTVLSAVIACLTGTGLW